MLRIVGLAAVAALLLVTTSGLSISLVHAAVTFTVNKTADTNDGTCDADCSLREAINAANALAGKDTIAFNIPISDPGYMTSTPTWWRIQPTSALPTITDPVVIDGYTQPGASPNTNSVESGLGLNTVLKIELDGSNAGAGANGLYITGGDSTVKGLVINRFSNNGIRMTTNGENLIQGNFIGTDTMGTTALGNRSGILMTAVPGNIIGGTVVNRRNVISANTANGIEINGNAAARNTVQGNFIGTDVTGTVDLGNTAQGVGIDNAPNTTIGGTTLSVRNVISGNDGNGVNVFGSNATETLIGGNFIGTDVTGTADLGNTGQGVGIGDASNTTIGGTVSAARNVISGNDGNGIHILGNGATGNLVQGNYIGTDLTGTAPLGNFANGVGIVDASDNTIGGVVDGVRNVISGNGNNGILISGSSATGNLGQGNFIGTDVTGTIALGNHGRGIRVQDAPSNTIGGTASGARNIISGNGFQGIFISGIDATGNVIKGNYVGTDASGSVAIPNSSEGVAIRSANNIIGGSGSNEANLISGNEKHGVGVQGTDALGNVVAGNLIGTDVSGQGVLGNGVHGVSIDLGANGNTVGGTATGDGNTIAFNGGAGIAVDTSTGNRARGNSIFSNIGSFFGNTGLGIDLSPGGVTPNDVGDADTGPNNLQNFPVLTSAVSGGGTTTIQGTFNSTANITSRVEFFSNPSCDPSGYGEGEKFIGFTNVTTDGSGNANLNVAFPTSVSVSHFITATAADPSGNTSEFSQCLAVAAASTPTPLPGVSVLGLAALAGLLGAASFWAYRRQKQQSRL